MTSKDKKLDQQINAYVENEYMRYVAWYTENSKLAKNNAIAALVVVLICVLCFVFFPSSMDEMSFFQNKFDPTNAIKIGLLASIILAVYSLYTIFKRWKFCLAIEAQLQSEFSLFGERDEAAFKAFKANVDGIMAASNPEVVIAVEQDNLQKGKSSQA